MKKWKPWEREKALGKKAPHPVDERLGFVDSTQYPCSPKVANGHPLAIGGNFDRMRIGRIEDGRRYLGEGCWQRVDHEHSETNERREGRP
jgi:hypothetical protein